MLISAWATGDFYAEIDGSGLLLSTLRRSVTLRPDGLLCVLRQLCAVTFPQSWWNQGGWDLVEMWFRMDRYPCPTTFLSTSLYADLEFVVIDSTS